MGFLVAAYAGSVSSQTAEFISTNNNVTYGFSMAFHIAAALLFTGGAALPTQFWQTFKRDIDYDIESASASSAWMTETFFCVLAIALLIVFVVSIFQARYQVFLDIPNEQIIRRDTHLQPPGVIYHTVDFFEVVAVGGEIVRHSHDKDSGSDLIEFHSVISISTAAGRILEVGENFPAQSSRQYAAEAQSLAQIIAGISGADLDLK